MKNILYSLSTFVILATGLFIALFFYTYAQTPHTSELVFVESSSMSNIIGSVVPASCESAPPTSHGIPGHCPVPPPPAYLSRICDPSGTSVRISWPAPQWATHYAVRMSEAWTGAPMRIINNDFYGTWYDVAISPNVPYVAWTHSRLAIDGIDYFSPAATETRFSCPPPPPPTLNLTATPLSITAGQGTTLYWSSTNVTSCTAVIPGFTGPVAVSGTSVQVPTVTSTYTLNCTGSGGSISRSVTVAVNAPVPPPPLPTLPTLDLTASPLSITSGQSTTLSWSSTNVNTCTAVMPGFTGLVILNGSSIQSPTVTTTYTLNCNGFSGPISRSVTVYVGTPVPPPTLSLYASPNTIAFGQSTTLYWSSTNVTSCTAVTPGWTGGVPVSGTSVQTPTAISNYILNCTGPGGAISRNAIVWVGAPIIPPTPTPLPPAPPIVTPTSPTGYISMAGTSCQVQPGQSTCDVYVNWGSSNFVGSPVVRNNSNDISNAASYPAPGLVQPISPGLTTFSLNDQGSTFSTSVHASVTCASGGVWTGVRCEFLPVIDLSADPDLVRSGTSAQVGIQVSSNIDLLCTFNDGRPGVAPVFTHIGAPSTFTHPPIATKQLTSAQDVRVTCTSPLFPAVTNTQSIRINVIPTFQEI